MIKLSQLKFKHDANIKEIKRKAGSRLRISPAEIAEIRIEKKSIDARKKDSLIYNFSVNVVLKDGLLEEEVLRKSRLQENEAKIVRIKTYTIPEVGSSVKTRPVVVGFGPAGIFAAYYLSLRGLRPIVIERGDPSMMREEKVLRFWKTGELDPDCNVQFGEGGAGAFSDGKLTTSKHDPSGKMRFILETFVKYGADSSLLMDQNPHIGTDRLIEIVQEMRREIEAHGGEVRFRSRLTGLKLDREGKLREVLINDDEKKGIKTGCLILAIGHSARDTFEILHNQGLKMEKKSFAVGLRIEHLQREIDKAQYGAGGLRKGLPAASYKLTSKARDGRGVYTFCMCPGGFVVNASSEAGHLAVNGMSYSERDNVNGNSAVVVTVGPEDFGDSDNPLAGMEFQRRLEKSAFEAAAGKVPIQLYGDFLENKVSTGFGKISPEIKGDYAFANLREILPPYISESLVDGMKNFGRKLKGFDVSDAVFSGVESRTSSPVRILRNEFGASSIIGVFPCGEGAGYAGGIMSAAADGLSVAEKLSIYLEDGIFSV